MTWKNAPAPTCHGHGATAEATPGTRAGTPRRLNLPALVCAALLLAMGSVYADYTVKKGDTLGSIAKKHGVTVKQLQSWNGIKGTMIRPGQVLKVSASGGATKEAEPKEAAPAAQTEGAAPATTAGTEPAAQLPTPAGALTDELVTGLAATPKLGEYLYTVQEGDNLAGVAKKFGASVKAVQWLNDLSSDRIRIEQQLLIPSTKGGSRGKLIASHAALPEEERMHTVEKGESLSAVAQKFETTVTRLRWRNGLKSNTLVAGQQLVIPGKNATNATPQPPPPAPKTPATPPTTAKTSEPVQDTPPETASPQPLPTPAQAEAMPDVLDGPAQERLARSGAYAELIHTVQPGDTVAKVAAANGSTEAAIRWLNDLGDKEIETGQVILVPSFAPVDTSGILRLANYDPLPAQGPSPATEITHEVTENDTLSVLAMQYNTTLARLRWRNNLANNVISVGDKLTVVTTRPPAKQ